MAQKIKNTKIEKVDDTMKYVPKAITDELKRIDLYTYLRMTKPNELIHEGGENYTTRTHDSLKISNGMWNWFSKGIGGRSAVDFIIADKECEFKDALFIMIDELNIKVDNYQSYIPKIKAKQYENSIQKEEKHIVLPDKSETSKRVFAYLASRGIDKEIINYCLKNNLIYEDTPYHNVVFLGYDEQNEVKFGCVRATNSTRYMHDLKGSSKEYSFRLLSKTTGTDLHIFESAIDLLSYATLLKMWGLNFQNYNLMSLSGVYQPAKVIEQSKIPVVLEKYLEKNKTISKIILHFDNDIAGRNATNAFQIVLKNRYEVVDKSPKSDEKIKDVNDYLCSKLQINATKNKEFSR